MKKLYYKTKKKTPRKSRKLRKLRKSRKLRKTRKTKLSRKLSKSKQTGKYYKKIYINLAKPNKLKIKKKGGMDDDPELQFHLETDDSILDPNKAPISRPPQLQIESQESRNLLPESRNLLPKSPEQPVPPSNKQRNRENKQKTREYARSLAINPPSPFTGYG